MSGQDKVNSYVYPELDFTHCHYHLKENIKKNGGGLQDIAIFQELAYSFTDKSRNKKYRNFMRNTSKTQKVKDYISQSIMPVKETWAIYTIVSVMYYRTFHIVLCIRACSAYPYGYRIQDPLLTG